MSTGVLGKSKTANGFLAVCRVTSGLSGLSGLGGLRELYGLDMATLEENRTLFQLGDCVFGFVCQNECGTHFISVQFNGSLTICNHYRLSRLHTSRSPGTSPTLIQIAGSRDVFFFRADVRA